MFSINILNMLHFLKSIFQLQTIVDRCVVQKHTRVAFVQRQQLDRLSPLYLQSLEIIIRNSRFYTYSQTLASNSETLVTR